MGEQFESKRAKSYKQYADKACERELNTATLFSRAPETLGRAYNCEGAYAVRELVGAEVTLHPTSNGVRVVHGSKEIGVVIEDEAATLARVIREESYCPGFALGRIDDASAACSDFVVTVIDHTEDE